MSGLAVSLHNPPCVLIPAQRAPTLIFNHPRLEEIFLFLQVDDFAHPREGVGGAGVLFGEADLGATAVGNVFEVVVEHGGVEAEHAAWHGVDGVAVFEFDGFADHVGDFFLEFAGPHVRVFDLDLVDDVDAEVHVHAFVAHDVLELFGCADHFVAAAKGEHLGEADIEKNAFEDDVEGDQVAHQALVGFGCASVEIGVSQALGVGQGPGGLVMDRGHFAVHVEDLGFVQPQAFDYVLIGVGVQRFLEGLAQQVLAAFGIGDVAVHGQHQVVGHQRIGGGEETHAAFDDQAFVVGEAIGIFPQRDVGGHVDFLRHPVIGAGVEVFLPRPGVFERHKLIKIGTAVDNLFIVNLDARGTHFKVFQAKYAMLLFDQGQGDLRGFFRCCGNRFIPA